MSVNLSPLGGAGAQFFTNDGVPLTGGLLYTYLSGTTTPATTYTSGSGITALPNPIILDAAGRVPTGEIWLSDGISYKFVLKDSTDVLIATWDGLSGINSNFIAYTSLEETATATAGQTVFNLTIDYIVNANSLAVFVNGSNQIVNVNYLETDSNTVTFLTGLNVGDVVKFSTATPVATNAVDAANVSYTPAGVGAVTTSVQAKLRESVSVMDFGATGDGVTDDTAAIQAAVTYALSTGKYVFAPVGVYLLSAAITIGENVRIYGENYKRYRNDGDGYTDDKTVFNQTADSECIIVPNNTINWSLDSIEFAYNGPSASTKAAVSVQVSNSFTLSNLTFKAFKYAYLANNTWSVTITNLHIYECDYGLFFGTPGSIETECGTSQTVTNVWVLYPGVEAYTMYGLHYSSFINCYCDHVDTGATVFKVYNSPSVSFYNCAAEDFTGGAVMSATESMCTFIGLEVLFLVSNSTANAAFTLSGKHSFINCCVRQASNLSPAPSADFWTFTSQARLGPAPDGTTKSVLNIQGNETLGLTGCKLRGVLITGSDSEVAGIYSSSLVYDGGATTYNALVAVGSSLIRPIVPLTYSGADITTIGSDIRNGDFGLDSKGLGVQIGGYYYNLNDLNVHLLISNTTWATLTPCTSYINFSGIFPVDAAAGVPSISTNFFKIASISTNAASPSTIGTVGGKTIQIYNDTGVLKVKHDTSGQNYTFVYSFNVV
jgi:hypothetical protein